ncbi:hypothetical protein M9434_005513 [Picochlorum sp. BPE23]|nr:hypothetical protein M9434_005513 [Picochlorum sp. BPE23]
MDTISKTNTQPVDSYWKTEIQTSLRIRRIESGKAPKVEEPPTRRKVSQKEKESKDRLQRLVEAHAPRGNRSKK